MFILYCTLFKLFDSIMHIHWLISYRSTCTHHAHLTQILSSVTKIPTTASLPLAPYRTETGGKNHLIFSIGSNSSTEKISIFYTILPFSFGFGFGAALLVIVRYFPFVKKLKKYIHTTSSILHNPTNEKTTMYIFYTHPNLGKINPHNLTLSKIS